MYFLPGLSKNIKAYSLHQTTNSEHIYIDFCLWDMFENNEKKYKTNSVRLCALKVVYM